MVELSNVLGVRVGVDVGVIEKKKILEACLHFLINRSEGQPGM